MIFEPNRFICIIMNKLFTLLLISLSFSVLAQQDSLWKKQARIYTPEILLGQTFASNDGFPDRGIHKQLLFQFGRNHQNNPQEWAQRYKGIKTGVGFGITDFGNLDSLGVAFTIIPQVEFNAFGSKRFSTVVGLGASYFTKNYDLITNPNNQAVTTDYTWAFRLFLHYKFYKGNSIDWRIGAGYSHHSNGHTKLLNQGYNSILFSVSGEVHQAPKVSERKRINSLKKSRYKFIDARYGQGFQVLGLAFNKNKPVYTGAITFGNVYNNSLKIGVGAHYRFYQNYYDYIQDNESLVRDGKEFENFRERPFYYASNLGIHVNAEFLLNHFGIDITVGYNIYKPGYQIDWRINEGWDNTPREITNTWMLGEFNSKYHLKKSISTRMGLKYYLFGTHTYRKQNYYIGAHLNSNLGQADFTEVSIGYTYNFRLK